MANTLYEYYKKLGKSLPSVQERSAIATKAGIKGYSGLGSENATLLAYLQKPQSATQNINNQTRQGIVGTNRTSVNADDINSPYYGGASGRFDSTMTEEEKKNRENLDTTAYQYGVPSSEIGNFFSDENYIIPAGRFKGYTKAEVDAQKAGEFAVPVNSKLNTGTGAITNTQRAIISNAGAIQERPEDVASAYKKFSLDPSTYDTEVNSTINNRIKSLKETATGPIDEEAIRKSFKNRIQASIDAINQTYSTMLARTKIRGENNQGVSRAISARSGLLGSSFDEANVANIGKANTDAENSVEAERMGLINKMLNDTEDKSTDFISRLRQQREDANTKLMDTILTRETRTAGKASKLAQYLLAQGFENIDELSPEDQRKIAENYGVDPETLTTEFDKAKIARLTEQDKLDKDRYQTISDGAQLYDKKTGQLVENTKNFAPNKYSNGGTSTGGGTGGGSGAGYGITYDGTRIKLSPTAQTWVDKINREGGDPKVLLPGTSKYVTDLRTEVEAGLNAQGGVGNFDRQKNMQLVDVVDATIAGLSKNKELSGKFRTRNAVDGSFQWLPGNWSANKNTDFVNQADKLKGQLLKLDGVALKAIFGPQISNSDASMIKEIIGNALDPKNQTPEKFQESLDDISRGLAEYRKNNMVAPVAVAPRDNGEEYNYTRDLRLAQEAIAKGANEAQVMARFNAKYK